MTTIADRYRLEREIGRGGMGEVWLAEDLLLERQVAAKRIGSLPGTTDADLDRVRREAQVSAMLNHEHVVVVFDLVEEAGQHWLVMEYVESENLAELVRRQGPIAPDEAATLIAQAAAALAAAHGAGIVHRDVKPSNILVTPDGQVKLGDFGIARLEADQALTQTGLLVGSPGFLAPEVAGGSAANAASDMWSLGATVFHAVEGRSPYETVDGNVIGTLYRIVNEPPPRPEQAGWLGPLIEHLMVHDPSQRWNATRATAYLTGGPDGGLATQTMAAAAAPPVPEPQPLRPAPVDASTSVIPAQRRRRGPRIPREATIAITLVAVVAVLLVAAIIRGLGSSGNPVTAPGDGTSGGTGQSASPASSNKPTTAGITSFIEGYLADAPNDPHKTFGQLTSSYQDSSGGFDGYEGFWGTIASAQPSNIKADTGALTVSYDVAYVMQSGEKRSESVTLRLRYDAGSYLIDGNG